MAECISLFGRHSEVPHTPRNPLDCLLCNSEVKVPVRLPCQHYFCRHCIEGSRNCTVCQHPIDATNDLAEDKVLSYIVESSSEATETCANCDQIRRPMFFCDTCQQPLCSECRLATHRAKIFSTHNIVELEERGRMRNRPVCPQHNEPFILFCLNLKSLMCIECFNSSSIERRGHFVNIDVAHKICCSKLEKNAIDLRSFQNDLREQIDLRQRLITELIKNESQLRTDIEKKCDEIIVRVNNMRDQLIRRVSKEREEREQLISAQLGELNNLGPPVSVNLLAISIFCSYSSKMDMLHCYADLHRSAQQFLSSSGRQLIPKIKFDCQTNLDFASEFNIHVCQPLGFSNLTTSTNVSEMLLNCEPTSRSHISDSPEKEIKRTMEIVVRECNSVSTNKDVGEFPEQFLRRKFNGPIANNSFTFAPHFDNENASDQRFMEQFQLIALPLTGFAKEISQVSKALLDLQRDITLRRCVVNAEDMIQKIASCEDAWSRLDAHRKVQGAVSHYLKQLWRREIERVQRQQIVVREKDMEMLHLQRLAWRAVKIAQQLKPFAMQMASLIAYIDIRRTGSVLPSPMEQICSEIAQMEPNSESRVAAIEKEEESRRLVRLKEESVENERREALQIKKALKEIRPMTTPRQRSTAQLVLEIDRDRGVDVAVKEEGGCRLSPSSRLKRKQHRRSYHSSESAAEETTSGQSLLIAEFNDDSGVSAPTPPSHPPQTTDLKATIPEEKDPISQQNNSKCEDTAGEIDRTTNIPPIPECIVSAKAKRDVSSIRQQMEQGRDPAVLSTREKLLELIREKVRRIE